MYHQIQKEYIAKEIDEVYILIKRYRDQKQIVPKYLLRKYIRLFKELNSYYK